MISTYNFLGVAPTTVAATDIANDNTTGLVNIKGGATFGNRKLKSALKIVTAAEVAGVVTLDFTGWTANVTTGRTSVINLQQFVNGQQLNAQLQVSELNGLAIVPQIAATAEAIRNAGLKVVVTTTATTVVITAQTGLMSAILRGSVSGSAPVAYTLTTAGVNPVNTTVALAAKGVSGWLAGQVYTAYEFVFERPDVAGDNVQETEVRKHTVYINDAATNRAALVTATDTLITTLFSA
jgi:hypothetical protein